MKFVYMLLVAYFLKIVYDFFKWIYGYYLRIKWVSYFKRNDINFLSYTYQIEQYLISIPNIYSVDDLFKKYNQEKILKSFIISHGYYKHIFLQNFNIFYWIKFVIFLPQKILFYLNPRFKKKTLHFFNFIYWILGAIFTIYNNEITSYIKDLINLILKHFAKN